MAIRMEVSRKDADENDNDNDFPGIVQSHAG
jgi:hypothetical protein